jgi:hypothetical protein
MFRSTALALVLAASSSACILERGESHSLLSGPSCQTLDFDVDAAGFPIRPGEDVSVAYAAFGVTINAWRNDAFTDPGMPIAYDGESVGREPDLAFPEQGNLLVSQACPTEEELASGFVDDPDPSLAGARFELLFDSPRCVESLSLFDIDHDNAVVKLYDASGDKFLRLEVPPTGDRQRVDVTLPAHECVAVRVVVYFCGTGAVDDIKICEANNNVCPGGQPATAFFRDADGDGFGDPAVSVTACSAPDGFVANDDDCDDDNDLVGPIDFFADTDGDGFGDPTAAIPACSEAPGRVTNDDDCNDDNAAINPDANEILGNAVDENCDGLPL